MPSLSTPIGELRPPYGVVVIGSGYGGAIAARRMAERAKELGKDSPAFSVCVLERGLERRPGEYPESLAGAVGQMQIDTRHGHVGRRTGLFDFRLNQDISVLVGAAVSGAAIFC